MCSVLGMHVRQNNPRSRDPNTKVYVCNHVTEFDHNVINLLTSCSTVSGAEPPCHFLCSITCVSISSFLPFLSILNMC